VEVDIKRASWALTVILPVLFFVCTSADAEITTRHKATGSAGYGNEVFSFN
jgi:hypothetical protein